MFELDSEDSFIVDPALRQPATMLEALQFMAAQFCEILEPDSSSLPRASVESIRAQIWETHECALRAEMEEHFSCLRDRVDLDRFHRVIDSLLSDPSSLSLS